MEGSTTKLGGGGHGAPTKFLVNTYLMVDDPSTNEIISWGQNNKSFIIKNPNDISRLLRQYFKHSNFYSFVRQLNIYGFRKIKHDQSEYANKYFLKDQHHLLGNIRRKKTVHSRSHGESKRLSFEAEIEKLSNEKASVESNISSFKQEISARKLHVGNLERRLKGIENRQMNLKNAFEMVMQNSKFVGKVYKKIDSLQFSNKRPFNAENSFVDDEMDYWKS
ncbi:heat stress transcription factor A-5-like [Vicia villosa]|uniref:heat stress transcription factor A-5-like n=1 Tax=Vicia villosa TaxID=3911 RepID=UPI00273C1DDA|nr:heat stress transcription factor A-5-like [Vicia villosa]